LLSRRPNIHKKTGQERSEQDKHLKCTSFAEELKVPIPGKVENRGGFICSQCTHCIHCKYEIENLNGKLIIKYFLFWHLAESEDQNKNDRL